MGDSPVVPLPPWVSKINSGKQKGSLQTMFFFLMKELHLSYEDLANMPVPAILAMADELNEYNKEQNKQMKKANRRH